MIATVLLYAMLAYAALVVGYVALRYDLYDREPWYAIAGAIIVGAGLMWLAGRAQGAFIHWAAVAHPSWMHNLTFALAAGISEEVAKLAAVLAVALAFRKHFNDPMDGLVYGSMAGLGAAIEESILVMGIPGAPTTLPAQEPIRLAGHLLMGGMGGWGLGLMVVASRRWVVVALACLAAAIALHTLWDWIAFSAAHAVESGGRQSPWHTLGAMGVMLAGLAMFRWLVAVGSRRSRERFLHGPFPRSRGR